MPPRKRQYLIRSVPSRVAPSPAPPAPGVEERAQRLYGRTLHELVAEAAYYRSLRRGSGSGGAEQDWYEAEREILARLAREGGPA